jgi:hypothetical protein
VKGPAALRQETAVGHLVGQGVREGVHGLGREPCLVEDFGRLQRRQTLVHHRLGALGHRQQQP